MDAAYGGAVDLSADRTGGGDLTGVAVAGGQVVAAVPVWGIERLGSGGTARTDEAVYGGREPIDQVAPTNGLSPTGVSTG
jgi:hypothetical protein